MRNFDFYEFVALIIPGSVLMISIGLLLRVDPIFSVLIPESFGELGAHVLVAYLAGHLLQGIGNYIEFLYWKLWKGMPTDWPISRKKAEIFPRANASILNITGASRVEDIRNWRGLVAQARSLVYSEGRANRLQYFNGTYGLFRGVVAAGLIVASFAWNSPMNIAWVYLVIVLIIGISLNRMHRFAVHYANELFATVSVLVSREKGDDSGRS
ncbi:hypothetical protein ACFLYE_00975 [Chloroflexota bacterium]